MGFPSPVGSEGFVISVAAIREAFLNASSQSSSEKALILPTVSAVADTETLRLNVLGRSRLPEAAAMCPIEMLAIITTVNLDYGDGLPQEFKQGEKSELLGLEISFFL